MQGRPDLGIRNGINGLIDTSKYLFRTPCSRITGVSAARLSIRRHSITTRAKKEGDAGPAGSSQQAQKQKPVRTEEDAEAEARRWQEIMATWSHTGEYQARLTGYLPYEYIRYSDNQMAHELSIVVNVPINKLFKAWKKRENYGIWFDIIGKTIIHEDNPSRGSYFLYYQWGNLPALELYCTVERTLEAPSSCISEKAVDGMPYGATVAFQRIRFDSCKVNLRVAYLLPTNLSHYVGPAGVWADVDNILKTGLRNMKVQMEAGSSRAKR